MTSIGPSPRRAGPTRTPDTSIYDFIHGVLTLDLLGGPRRYRRRDVVDAALKFQQYTGPVTAKAVEDTTFYRYLRLVSQNEVGGEPERFGTSPGAFHESNRRRQRQGPLGMLTTSTHDHKRGEDVRARLNVLSEVPASWSRHVQRWLSWNRRKRTDVDGRAAPSRNDEYLFYQTIVGAWPLVETDAASAGSEDFAARIDAYLRKAVREAKVHTSWAAPNEAYEAALSSFVTRCLDVGSSRPFVDDVRAFVDEIARPGAVNGLAQAVLKLTSPGVPDVYQGTEFWDFSLVDPDNRRPVDYERRRAAAASDATASELLDGWRDGRIKGWVMQRVLALRAADPDLFTVGTYEPLGVDGPHADRVIAFARRLEERTAVVLAPRLVGPLLRDETAAVAARLGGHAGDAARGLRPGAPVGCVDRTAPRTRRRRSLVGRVPSVGATRGGAHRGVRGDVAPHRAGRTAWVALSLPGCGPAVRVYVRSAPTGRAHRHS